ncbi:PTS sugar transporter subunit IIA [Lonsdalea quercina]|uniref:PTS sugar transporter subunit IIA n=1 Tax=Lonsdalea quercina TaxID=71657 RepID=UPI0039762169
MLATWLTPKTIHIVDRVSRWQEALMLAAEPLLADDAITQDYIEAIVATHQTSGPYYVIAPGLALPHARPEQGARKNGLSLLCIRKGVNFESAENDPVTVVIMLCALSGDEHIRMITELAALFSDEESLQQLLTASSLPAIQAVIENY